jgi:hypothetical protein
MPLSHHIQSRCLFSTQTRYDRFLTECHILKVCLYEKFLERKHELLKVFSQCCINLAHFYVIVTDNQKVYLGWSFMRNSHHWTDTYSKNLDCNFSVAVPSLCSITFIHLNNLNEYIGAVKFTYILHLQVEWPFSHCDPFIFRKEAWYQRWF